MSSQTRSSGDDGSRGPAYKRRRVGLACKSCRGRKSRCDGAQPSCGLCIELGFECTYERPTAPNASQQKNSVNEPNDRLVAIERVLEMLVQRDKSRSDQEHLSYQAQLSQQSSDPNGQVTQQRMAQQPTPQSQLDSSNEVGELEMRESSEEESIDGLATVSNINYRGSVFFGPSSNIALLRLAAAATPKAWQSLDPLTMHSPGSRHLSVSHNRPSASKSSYDRSTRPVDCYQLPSKAQGLQLLKTFFSDTGMLFPYIYEARAKEAFISVMRSGARGARPATLCLLHIIFAFGARTNTDDGAVEQGDAYAQRAQALVPQLVFRTAGIETIQALLLVTQYLQGMQQSHEIWNVFGLACRAAFHLGLHSHSSSKGLGSLDAEIRKRIWFGCVFMDISLSMTFGRPPSIPNEYIRLEMPLNARLDNLLPRSADNEQLQVDDGHDTVSLFIATLELFSVQRDILSTVYDSNLESELIPDPKDLLQNTLRLDRQLHDWWTTLGQSLKLRPWLEDNPAVQAGLPHAFDKLSVIMRLRYLNTQILLYRPTLALVLRSKTSARGQENSDHSLLSDQVKDRSVTACLEAASEVIEIVHKCYSDPSLLGAEWFSAYYTFNAALVLYIGILIVIHNNLYAPAATLPSTPQVASIANAFQEVNTQVEKLNDAAEAIYGVCRGAICGIKLRDTVRRLTQAITTYLDLSAATSFDHASLLSGYAADADSSRMLQQSRQLPSHSAQPFMFSELGSADLSNLMNPLTDGFPMGRDTSSWTNDFIFHEAEMFFAGQPAM